MSFWGKIVKGIRSISLTIKTFLTISDKKLTRTFNSLRCLIPNPKIRIISVDGNIGSGKSTMLEKAMQNIPNTILAQEPVKKWQNIDGTGNKEDNDILSAFYNDMKDYGYKLQNFAYITRLRELRDVCDKINSFQWKPTRNLWCCITRKPIVIVSERSILTDKHVFAQMLYDDKLINVLDKKLYDEWFNYFDTDYQIKHVIFIKSTPEISVKRIAKRGRESEKKITIEYLKSLLSYHNNWLNNSEKLNVLTLNTDDEFENDTPESVKRLAEHVSKISNFINNIV